MRLSHLYLILCVVGFIVPYAELVSWLVTNGIDIPAFFDAMMINGISRFFVWDVLISAVVVFVATYAWRNKLSVRWPPVVATLLVGVSLGLPLLLYLMEKQKTGGTPATA